MLLLPRSRGQQIDDLLAGFVGAVISGFQLAGRLVTGDRAVVEAAVGERPAEPFVDAQKEERLSGRGGRRSGIRPGAAGRGL